MKTPCDNTAEEVPFNSNDKKRSKFNIFDKKECATARLVVFSVIQVPGRLSSYSTLLAFLGDYKISVSLRENHMLV